MSLTIMRRIKFCAGHRLHRHGGKCEFFHGHNYVADFYVTAEEVDDIGRVIDFADLKRLFKATETEAQFRRHGACELLGSLAWILEGEIRRAEGDLEGAIRALRMAAATYDSLEYDEPEPLPFAAGHWLGAALLEAKRYEEAEEVYRKELRDHPHNGWSLYGLREALEAQGKSDPAVDADFEASWARSDTWIRSSRF